MRREYQRNPWHLQPLSPRPVTFHDVMTRDRAPDPVARRIRTSPALLGLLVLLLAALPANAQPVDDDSRPIFNFTFENDLFADSDGHYTNGIQFSWLTGVQKDSSWLRDAAEAMPVLDPATKLRFDYTFGQQIYTPRDIDISAPQPNDRPWAGWLYFNLGAVGETDGKRLDQFQAGIGVVGPASLAKDTQKFVHTVIGGEDPKGWNNQLKNEPTLQFTYQRSWRALASGKVFGFEMDATPHLGAALGNVLIFANGGAMVRFGQHLPDDYGPPRLDTGLAGSGYFKPKSDWGWYVFAGADGRAVGHNIFLDGNSFRDGPSVDKKTLVGDLQAGFAIILGDTRIAYTQVFETKQFYGQDEGDSYGSVTLSIRF